MPELNDPEIYQTVLDNLQTGVYIVDRNRRIRFWNEGAEQITGYLRQDVVGRFLRDHLLATGDEVKDFDADPEDPISLVFRDGKPSTMDVSILHKDGYPEDAIEKHGLRGSAVRLLQKPFTHESLAQSVREALGPARRA
ncbi:MAG TPA: PAS domain-containing protein [Verrucomicrobiae bacterium]|jgi:PAS domain S-box-containing protein|nr:PAS domain-containing protein [Verrucomicrobiae bacterium]